MNNVFTILYVFAFALISSAFVCNYTNVDENDPETVQLAQLDAIKCLIVAAKQQHAETLSAISSIAQRIPRPTNFNDVIITIFSSFLGLFIISQVVRSAWYYALVNFDALVELNVSGRRCMRFDIRPTTPEDIMEFRNNLKPPLLSYVCWCCCRRPRNDVVEM